MVLIGGEKVLGYLSRGLEKLLQEVRQETGVALQGW